MKVFRISKTKYAEDLSGMGSKLYGGRWNAVGTPCIYTSESRALAVLEYSVNVNIDFIPRGLSLCIFEIDENQIQQIEIQNLPGNCIENPTLLSTKEFGNKLLSECFAILNIYYVVITDVFNFILYFI